MEDQARLDERGVLLIAGPTAGGKSALALALAERRGGIVVNADSMAVYRDLSILTGRPTAEEEARAPHRLYGHEDAGRAYSVGRWLAQAAAELDAARASGRIAIVVGGTGLYFKAMTEGLSDIPAVEPGLRERLRRDTEGVPPQTLHARLAALDPMTAARLRPTDPQRILRALEIFESTGLPLASFQDRRTPPVLTPDRYDAVVIAPERRALAQAIEHRFDRMMARGAVEEAAALAARGLDRALPAMRALGVPPLLDHLDGHVPIDAAVRLAKAQTRAYAKRQMTFARHQLPTFAWMTPDEARERWRGP